MTFGELTIGARFHLAACYELDAVPRSELRSSPGQRTWEKTGHQQYVAAGTIHPLYTVKSTRVRVWSG